MASVYWLGLKIRQKEAEYEAARRFADMIKEDLDNYRAQLAEAEKKIKETA